MSTARLATGDLKAAQALPWDLCDQAGRLLLRRGFVIEQEAQLARLLEAGLYRRADSGATAPASAAHGAPPATGAAGITNTVFFQIARVLAALELLLSNPPAGSFSPRILRLASVIQACFELDPDAAIATVQMLQSHRYSTRRLVHAAILMELLLRSQGESEARRQLALAAALTMNIAMLELQDVLNHQTTPPDPAQKALLRQHPEHGVQALRRLGVADPLWLELVAQHHETIDGKGYPRGLKASQINPLDQLLSMVDRYGSMAIGRAYRLPVLPNVVLKQIFMDKQSVSPELAAQLISAVGIYPPGSLVALAGGELAVVLRRTSVASQPLVAVLKSSRGQLLDRPRRRLTSEASQAITGLVSRQELGFELDPAQLWDQTFELDSSAFLADSAAAVRGAAPAPRASAGPADHG